MKKNTLLVIDSNQIMCFMTQICYLTYMIKQEDNNIFKSFIQHMMRLLSEYEEYL